MKKRITKIFNFASCFAFYLLFSCQHQTKQKFSSEENIERSLASDSNRDPSSKAYFLTHFTTSKELQSALKDQMILESKIEKIASDLYDILVNGEQELGTCSDFNFKTILDMDYSHLRQILLDMGKLRFLEEAKIMSIGEMLKWYDNRLASGELIKEISEKNNVQDSHNKLIVLLEFPTILLGMAGAIYTMRDIRKWNQFLDKERTIKVSGNSGEEKEVILIRHSSGFLVKPDDADKKINDINDRYLDDPVTKKLICANDGKPQIFAEDALTANNLSYNSRKGIFVLKKDGKAPQFKRKPTDGSLELDKGTFQMLTADSSEAMKTALAKAKKNRGKFDPSAGNGIEKHFGQAGRWGIFFASLASAFAGIVLTGDTFLGLSANASKAAVAHPACSGVDSFRSLTLQLAKLRSDYMDMKTQVFLLLE